MITDVTHVTILVDETDEAIEWYTETLGFELRADEQFAPDMRWVTVAPEDGETELVLQAPNESYHGEERASEMRTQIGSGPMIVVSVDDCHDTVAALERRGATITRPPEEVPWGIHAIIQDLYGNPFNLVESH